MIDNIRTIDDLDLSGRTVLVRTEFNVPLADDGTIADLSRIEAAIPTLLEVLRAPAALVILSHRGRPWGERTAIDSLESFAPVLSELLEAPVAFAADCVGQERDRQVSGLRSGEALLLQNVRYHIEENRADEPFAAQLAHGVDVYINDAWGNSHRPHASMSVLPRLVPERAAGRLVEAEFAALRSAIHDSARPRVLVLGGAKAAGKDGKLHIMEHLLERMDGIVVGGRVALYLLAARGQIPLEILVDTTGTDAAGISVEEQVTLAASVLEDAVRSDCAIVLPVDARTEADDGRAREIALGDLQPNTPFLDIGPQTERLFAETISSAASVIWNGPMGAFERPGFDSGTAAVARAIALSNAESLVGGGDSARALSTLGLEDQVTHVSTGGGVVLTYLMGQPLPGLDALSSS
jgi:3-phosphoglycerate kinase